MPLTWRVLRHDGLAVWNPSLQDERARAIKAKADATALQVALNVGLWLSLLSYFDIWALRGHEVGYLSVGTMLLAQLTRVTLLEWRADGG